jgi:hypothetical protein
VKLASYFNVNVPTVRKALQIDAQVTASIPAIPASPYDTAVSAAVG